MTRRTSDQEAGSAHASIGDMLELAPKLSADDRALIRLLQENGRASFASLAAGLRLPERVIRRRVGELQDDGIIRITTVADPQLLGYSVTALLGIVASSAVGPTEVARRLSETPYAFYVCVVSGRFNVLAEVTCRDYSHLREVVERDILGVEGVSALTVFPYLDLPYQNPSFLQAREKEGQGPRPSSEAVRFDEVDRRIISFLYEDGRMPFIQIATAMGISESQVRQRLKRLLNANAVRVMAITNPRGMGFAVVAILAIRLLPGAESLKVADALAALPTVIYVAVPAGSFDVFAEVVCMSGRDLLDIIDTQIRAVPGVAATEAWVYLELHYRPVTPAEAIAVMASRSGE